MIKKIKHNIILVFIKILTLNYMLIKSILKKWSPKGEITVLDLGCGLGNLAPLFKSKGYLGVDIDEKSIEIAKQNYPIYTFKVGDITTFSINRNFDLVVAIGVFHHINDKQMDMGLNVIKKHLNKDGRAIIVEAIPPIFKWNIIGQAIRLMDQGHFIRPFQQYEKKIKSKFNILYAQERKGGIVDYGVFVITHKTS